MWFGSPVRLLAHLKTISSLLDTSGGSVRPRTCRPLGVIYYYLLLVLNFALPMSAAIVTAVGLVRRSHAYWLLVCALWPWLHQLWVALVSAAWCLRRSHVAGGEDVVGTHEQQMRDLTEIQMIALDAM